jgi:hypothetical protein
LGSMTIEEVISLFERDTEKRSRQD